MDTKIIIGAVIAVIAIIGTVIFLKTRGNAEATEIAGSQTSGNASNSQSSQNDDQNQNQSGVENNNTEGNGTENQNTEFKESWRDEYVKWVCGFANAQGGKLYIGINDKGE